MGYIITAVTDKGNFKKVNQDAFYVKSTLIGRTSIVFGVVCDGLGGLSYGEFASSFVVQNFIMWFEKFLNKPCINEKEFKKICLEWNNILDNCNKRLIAFGRRRNFLTGTTFNAILIIKNRYMIANLGDSRTFSIIKRVKQITKDHSVVEKEVEDGCISPEDAKNDSRQNILTKCLGVLEYIDADFYYGKIKSNQILINCSDGFYKEVNRSELAKIFKEGKSYGEYSLNNAVRSVVDLVKNRGENDNITVLAIKKEKLRFL